MAESNADAGAHPSGWIRSRLSAMMLLQYAIWGAWLPLLWSYLSNVRKFTDTEIGWAFAVGAVGAIVAPFVAGQVADRLCNTEKYLGVSHIIGGVLVYQLANIQSLEAFLLFSLAYSLVYSPTLPLTNSICFHHVDRDRDFGGIRLWGTIGWIAVGIAIGQWLLHQHTPASGTPAEILAAQCAGMADAFRLSGILGIIMGVYCFTLPATPPSKGAKANATFEAITEVRRQPLLMLFILAIPVSCIHQFYFMYTGGYVGSLQLAAGEDAFTKWVNSIFGVGGGGLMTVGQMSEVLVLALIPALAVRISRKGLLAIGLLAYAVRMALFSYAPEIAAAIGISQVAVAVVGIACHGLCFGCFIFVCFMIVDEETTGDVRASAQSLFNLVIIGCGVLVGSSVAARIAEWAKTPSGTMDYQRLFGAPMWAALACLVALALFYDSRAGKRAARLRV